VAVGKGKNENGFGEAVHDGQNLGFASDGETLVLKIHVVTGARFGGDVASEQSVGEAALPFSFSNSAQSASQRRTSD
jgi:hypothetical protein